MIAAILICWLVIGWWGMYVTVVALDPVIRRSDIFPMLIGGVLGPVAWLYFIAYGVKTTDWWNKPIYTAKRKSR